jgi:hypothetical protein
VLVLFANLAEQTAGRKSDRDRLFKFARLHSGLSTSTPARPEQPYLPAISDMNGAEVL